ncbi:MAG: hypothetical protein B6U95_00465 [Thermofilum sp. ex4484_82]|nr:MAG: hypothetical protein B6U95_00465 [Thermofilum sp. ex4484_82]OYT40020.1 MAG: hypothetical protein B6U96_00470 [Archaeoglobales archaeon ex4484_92]
MTSVKSKLLEIILDLSNKIEHLSDFILLGDVLPIAKQSFIALFINLGNLLSGLSVASVLNSLKQQPWIFRIYPQILGTRGILAGIFSARTSTSLHLGLIEPSLKRNTSYFYSLGAAMLLLTLAGALVISILFTFSTLNVLLEVHVIIYSTILLVAPLSFFIISAIAFKAFKKGLDPDILLYPFSSVINDILISLVFIEIGRLIVRGFSFLLIPVTFFFIAAYIAIGYYVYEREEREVLVSTIKEGFTALLIGLTIELGTGSVLSTLLSGEKRVTEIALMYPVMLSTLGGSASIIGSMVTTRIAIGEFDFSPQSFKNILQNIIGLQIASVFFHAILSVIVSLIVGSFYRIFMLFMFAYISHVLGFIIMIPIILLTAYETVKRGLDPDNFVNPIESSIADFVETFSIALVSMIL